MLQVDRNGDEVVFSEPRSKVDALCMWEKLIRAAIGRLKEWGRYGAAAIIAAVIAKCLDH